MSDDSIAKKIEAILFAVAEPQTVKSLSERLSVSEDAILSALDILGASLSDHAMTLVRDGKEVALVTREEHSALVETIRKEELSKELSKASAETLSIISYHPGVSRAQIEFIRGVNVSYSLRLLSMRGLVESRGVGRATGYYPTLQMLEHFGISRVEELPQFEETSKKITTLLSQGGQEE